MRPKRLVLSGSVWYCQVQAVRRLRGLILCSSGWYCLVQGLVLSGQGWSVLSSSGSDETEMFCIVRFRQ